MVWLLPSGLTPLTQSAGAGCLSVVSLATSWTTPESWTTPALLHDVTKVAKEMKPRHSRVFHASGSWLIMSRWALASNHMATSGVSRETPQGCGTERSAYKSNLPPFLSSRRVLRLF